MDEHIQQQTIEKYLRNELSAADREHFEQEMASDPILASDVRLHQMLQEEFGDREKQEFIKELDVLGDRYFRAKPDSPRKSWWWGFWLGGGILLAGIVIFRLLSVPPEMVNDLPDSGISVPSAPVEEESPPASAPETPVTPRRPQSLPKTPPAPRQESAPARPIAQLDPADLTPNPYLEDLIGSNIRGGELQFLNIAARFDQQQFKLEGQVKKQVSEEDPLVVFVYTNKEKDFLEGNFLASFPLELLPDGKTERTATGATLQSFRFSLAQNIDWKPGLYYYFLARESAAEPLHTGKIQLSAN